MDSWSHAALASGERVDTELPIADVASLGALEAPDDHEQSRARLCWKDCHGLPYALTKALLVAPRDDGSLSLATREGRFVRPRLTWMDLWRLRDEADDGEPS
jgi:hypothetical protein